MRFTTKTEYGLICLIHISRNSSVSEERYATIKDITKAEKMSEPYVAKILHKLKSAKIVTSHQGKQGGYALARDPHEITLKAIVEALEGTTFEVFCEPKIREEIVCTHFSMCGVSPIWNKTKEILDRFYSSVTLDLLADVGGQRLQKLVANL
jgi:Rrf2 family transcriptional regulator, iron-sulfur cluster assembly transcription factor